MQADAIKRVSVARAASGHNMFLGSLLLSGASTYAQ